MINHSRSSRNGPALRTLLAIFSLACIASALPLAAQTIVGSGINAQEGGQIAPISMSGQYTDSLWADSGNQRWMMGFHGVTGNYLPVAAWPCLTQGCMVYAGTPQVGSGYWTETGLQFPSNGGLYGLPLLSGSTVPQWGGGTGGTAVVALDLQTGTKALALASEVPNDSTTGTGSSPNKLAKITTTGAIILASTDLPSTPSYIVVAGNGTSGNAQLAIDGEALCTFDTTVPSGSRGNYVVAASGSTAGDCSGTTYASLSQVPFGTWIIGQLNTTFMIAANTTGLVLVHPGYRSLGPITSLSTTSSATILATAATSLGTATPGSLLTADGSGNVQASSTALSTVTTTTGLSAGKPVLGSGTALTSGTVSGITTEFATVASGTLTGGHLVSWNGSLDATDSGLVAANMVSTCAMANVNSGTGSTIAVPSSGTTKMYGFYLPCAVNTSNLTFYLSTTDTSGTNTYDIGIYDTNGSLKVHTGSTTGLALFGSGTGGKSVGWLSPPVLLVPGRYYFAWTTSCSSTCAVMNGSNLGTFSSGGAGSNAVSGALQSTSSVPTDSWTVALMPTFVLR